MVEHRNEIVVVGRVADDAIVTELPSGDEVVTVRLVVERPRGPAGRGSRQRVDVLACAAWTGRLRRTVRSWTAGDVVEVRGALRRRFWRAQNVPQSRYEIELERARLLVRADRPASVSPPASA